ncbi:redoxin domain-containing protein [Pseudothauera rhizosphaerae]|uniref:Redoxin domain-containing protein n=1 Tax=Pseudothauera rhizosphaerae TaxID=2565932 RepID=A0A4S4AJ38_9RHOO|nr:redoxin domain-containing protein [Pseudothauera rhizosphaerae]THF59398.1 redoxin domain-containing protein [Pseudothauera rhizosphaerae]
MKPSPFVSRLTTAAILAAGLLTGAALAAPQVGQPAPTFSATTADGNTLDLQSLRGRTVVLEWTNHDCPFVRKHYRTGNMQATQLAATSQGAVWLQIISSAPGTQGHVDGATALRLNSERRADRISHVVLDPDGKVGRLYGAQVTPHMYVIDAAGTLVYMGGIDSIPSANDGDLANATNYVRATLTALQAGQPVPNPVTRAYGCTVKYGS